MSSSSSAPFAARGAPDAALLKPRDVKMGPGRMQLANRVNGANKAKKLALLLTTKPVK